MKTILITILTTLVLSTLSVVVYHNWYAPKLAWVDFNKVYNEFQYKKELEAKFTKTQEARKKVIDSLELDLKMLYSQLQNDSKNKEKLSEFDVKRQDFMDKKGRLEEDGQHNQQNYQEQILNQLNQYVKDYGKEKGYSMILGADGSGTLMYAQEGIDITEVVIKYINNKYKGQ